MEMSFLSHVHEQGASACPDKSGHTSNAELPMIRHGGRCPDLLGPAGALRRGHGAKKDISMLNHIVSFTYNPEAKCRGHLLTCGEGAVLFEMSLDCSPSIKPSDFS
jgi:hypothetical protein